MKKYSHIYLLSDVDGTLLNDQKTIPQRNLNAIREFVAEGGHFGLASGRSQFNLGHASSVPRELLTSPSLLCNGAAIYDLIGEKYLYMGELDRSRLCPLIEDLIATRSDLSVQLYFPDGIYRVNPNKFLTDPLLPTEILKFPTVAVREMDHPIKIVNYYPGELMPGLKKDFPFEKYQDHYSIIDSGADYLEFLPLGCTKGSALNKMRELIPEGSVIYAIGDYLNDYEMLSCADVPVAPANADPRITALAKHIVCSNNEGAVADLIQNVIFKQE